jgi:hypothetical protein
VCKSGTFDVVTYGYSHARISGFWRLSKDYTTFDKDLRFRPLTAATIEDKMLKV